MFIVRLILSDIRLNTLTLIAQVINIPNSSFPGLLYFIGICALAVVYINGYCNGKILCDYIPWNFCFSFVSEHIYRLKLDAAGMMSRQIIQIWASCPMPNQRKSQLNTVPACSGISSAFIVRVGLEVWHQGSLYSFLAVSFTRSIALRE